LTTVPGSPDDRRTGPQSKPARACTGTGRLLVAMIDLIRPSRQRPARSPSRHQQPRQRPSGTAAQAAARVSRRALAGRGPSVGLRADRVAFEHAPLTNSTMAPANGTG